MAIRLKRIEKVRGSNPLSSTDLKARTRTVRAFVVHRRKG